MQLNLFTFLLDSASGSVLVLAQEQYLFNNTELNSCYPEDSKAQPIFNSSCWAQQI